MTLRIALAQIPVEHGKPEENYKKVAQYLSKAAQAKANVVVLPELWNTGYDLARLEEIADVEGQRTKEFLQAKAQEYKIDIVGGSVAIKENEQFYNTTYIVDKQGKLISEYRKVHLFRLMDEDKYLAAGEQKNVFELSGVKSASFICYDIRFPEWLRTVAKEKLSVIYVVAQWPQTRIEQWKALLIARAIENQTYVVAVNRVGENPDNKFNGHSLIINPLGEVLSDSSDQETLTVYDLDTSEMEKFTQQIYVFEDRRPELYD